MVVTGSKEWLDKWSGEYRLWLIEYAQVMELNAKGDYSQGWATMTKDGSYCIASE